MYMTAKQAAEKWGISDGQVRTLYAEGKIQGAIRDGKTVCRLYECQDGQLADGAGF